MERQNEFPFLKEMEEIPFPLILWLKCYLEKIPNGFSMLTHSVGLHGRPDCLRHSLVPVRQPLPAHR